jgi:predicted DNA-binding protein
MGGERRLANYRLPDELLLELERVAKTRGVTMTAIVEEAILEKLAATCESCGR